MRGLLGLALALCITCSSGSGDGSLPGICAPCLEIGARTLGCLRWRHVDGRIRRQRALMCEGQARASRFLRLVVIARLPRELRAPVVFGIVLVVVVVEGV